MKVKAFTQIKLAVAMFFVAATSFAQHNLPVNGERRISYRGEVALESAKQDDMNEKALDWLRARYFSSEVVQDKDDRSFIVRGFFLMPEYNDQGTMYHECRIKMEEGKYTYMFHNFIYTEPGGVSFQAEAYPRGWKGDERFYSILNKEVTTMVEDLQKYMASANTVASK